MGRIVRLEHVGLARQEKVPQTRYPEAQRARAEHVLPVRGLGGREWPHRMISPQHGLRAVNVQRAGGQVDTPVIHGHGQVEQPLVVAGEVEIEETAEFRRAAGIGVEQDVVTEQVAVARAAGQRGVVGAAEERGLVGDLAGQQLALGRVEERQDLGFGLAPPGQAAQVGLLARIVLPGQMHAGQHGAHLGAVAGLRGQLRGPGEPRDDGRRLALERAQDLPVARGHGRRHADAMPGQMVHQVQVVRQLREAQPLEDGQHVLARDAILLHGQKEIAVLDPGSNAAQRADFAKVVVKQPAGDLVLRDRGEYGHTVLLVRIGRGRPFWTKTVRRRGMTAGGPARSGRALPSGRVVGE
ncbi:hypothetical protein D3C87_1084680 [compost metagenome]